MLTIITKTKIDTKIAVIEKIHNDGLELLNKTQGYEYELITDVSENSLHC